MSSLLAVLVFVAVCAAALLVVAVLVIGGGARAWQERAERRALAARHGWRYRAVGGFEGTIDGIDWRCDNHAESEGPARWVEFEARGPALPGPPRQAAGHAPFDPAAVADGPIAAGWAAWQAHRAGHTGPTTGRLEARCGSHVLSLVLHDTQWQRAQDFEAWIELGLAMVAGCRQQPECRPPA